MSDYHEYLEQARRLRLRREEQRKHRIRLTIATLMVFAAALMISWGSRLG